MDITSICFYAGAGAFGKPPTTFKSRYLKHLDFLNDIFSYFYYLLQNRVIELVITVIDNIDNHSKS